MIALFVLIPFVAIALVILKVPVGYPATSPLVEKIKALRAQTDKARDYRCLSPLRRVYVPAGAVPKQARRLTIYKEKNRLARARAAEKRCLADRLWTWYETSGAACVKSKEGAWSSNTGNGYYGGFQADMSFQAAYGREYLRRMGTANIWPPISQIHMAYRGWSARGWYPWPNTARACGLL